MTMIQLIACIGMQMDLLSLLERPWLFLLGVIWMGTHVLLLYVVNGPLKDPNGMNFPQSMVFDSAFVLPTLVAGTRLHVGFLFMLVMTAAMTLFVFRSFAGYRLQVGGLAPQAARYAGFSSRAALWTALLLSGGLAGIAGAFEVTGPIGQLLPSISPGYGFAAIIVAFMPEPQTLLIMAQPADSGRPASASALASPSPRQIGGVKPSQARDGP